MTDTASTTTRVTYDAANAAVEIHGLTINDPAVTTEATRWVTGVRGPALAASELDGADLTAYVIQAIAIGAHAISAAGGAQDTFNLEQLVQDVAQRTSVSASQAAQATTSAVTDATKAITDASTAASKALRDANDEARKGFADSVTQAQVQLRDQITLLLGGEDPELLVRLKGLLAEFGANVASHSDEQVGKMFDKATRALDPDDPTSPLAKHRTQLDRQHEQLTAQVAKQHEQLTAAVVTLTSAVTATTAAHRAAAATASVTPLKGATFEDRVNAAISTLAAGFGDEYLTVGTTTGRIPNCKKGDGLLIIDGGRASVVIEAHDGTRARGWTDYLDEAERNRGAQASIGVVPTPAQNHGQTIRVIGPRRIVIAIEESSDSTELLRTVCILLRSHALASIRTESSDSLATAKERLQEALELLPKIEAIRKSAGTIRTSANNIDQQSDTLRTSLNRLLLQAQTALSGSDAAPTTTSDEQGLTGAA